MNHFLNHKQTEERILAFTKYARFIAEKFDVQIEFDGLNAHTDGRTITLPNLIGMSEREIEFLYCILLHEVGHIRYTDFSSEYIFNVKTENHFMLFNSIEDARIENLLMKDFDGAQNIFDRLYNDFIQDEEFKNRIFRSDLKPKSLIAALGLYLHSELLNLNKKSDLKDLVSHESYKKLQKFDKKYDLSQILDENPVRSQQDAFKLSEIIYDLYVKEEKDTSRENQLEDKKEALEHATDQTADMHGVLSQLEEEKTRIREELKELREKREKIENEIRPKIEEQDKIIKEKSDFINKCEELLSGREDLADLSGQRQAIQDKLNKKENSLKDLKEKINSLETKKESLTEKQQNMLSSLKDKEKSFLDHKKRYEERLKEKDSEIKEIQENLNKLPFSKDMEDAQVLKEMAQAEDDLNQAHQVKNEDLRELNQLSNEELNLQEEIEQKETQSIKDLSRALKEISDTLDQAGVENSLLPAFEKTPGWDDADQAQKDFDQSASSETGEIVVNGQSLSASNLRDILHLVDEATVKVNSLDLAEIFKKEQRTSLLESFNDHSLIKNTLPSETTKALSSTRPHLSLTKSFDRVRVKNKSTGKEFSVLIKKNQKTIEVLKNVLSIKLKFKKKAKFKANQDEGGLDTRSLWKLKLNDDRLYETIQPKLMNDTAVSIALDVSGSMDKKEVEDGLRLKEVSLIVSEALKSCFIKHEILGYHAPLEEKLLTLQASDVYNRKKHALETIVFKNFNDKDAKGVENLEIMASDNSDGESLKIAAERLKKERSKRKLLFVVTDGKPYLSGSDVSVLDQDLKNTILDLEKKGVEVYAFGFNEEPKEFYKNYCQIKDYLDLVTFFKEKF